MGKEEYWNKIIKTAFLVILVGTMVSGCAFGTRRPILKYTVTSPPGEPKNIEIYVPKFKDERIDKDVVGHVRNGWGMKTARVITETNVSEWVTDVLKQELKNAGYTISGSDTVPTQIKGEVIEIYCESFMMYEGKAVLEVTVLKNNELLFQDKYRGTDESLNWAATAKSYGITLERALKNAMSQIVQDINRKLEK